MAKQILFLLSLLVFSLLPLFSPLPSDAVLNAAEILSNSGFLSMALTLELITPTLTSQPRSATIFSPSDTAFAESGQPPLSLLQFHFFPQALSLESLRSLPYGTSIPTMASGKSLIVTTSASDQRVSINNVTINESPIFDDGSLIVFAIDKFFDMNFEVSSAIQNPSPDSGCVVSNSTTVSLSGAYSFVEASRMLRSRGYSVMASFLDLQLLGLLDQPKLTVFAPVDDAVQELVRNFSESSSLFLRHVVPCKLTWTDLSNFNNGTVLRTYSDRFTIRITQTNDQLMLNDVPVTFPHMYFGDWLVVHGLQQVLELPPKPVEGDSGSEFGKWERIAPHRSEF